MRRTWAMAGRRSGGVARGTIGRSSGSGPRARFDGSRSTRATSRGTRRAPAAWKARPANRRRDLAGLRVAESAAAHRPPTAYQARVRRRPAPAWRHHARAVQHLSRRRRRAPAAVWPAAIEQPQRTQRPERNNIFSLRSLGALRLCSCHMRLEDVNALDEEAAARTLQRCCGSSRWAQAMARRGRFRAPRR